MWRNYAAHGRFVPLMAQRHRCAISFLKTVLHMTTSEPFTPRIPDPDKAPRTPAHHQLPADKTAEHIPIPRRPKATFQWPPDCLWPFTETIGNDGWDSDA